MRISRSCAEEAYSFGDNFTEYNVAVYNDHNYHSKTTNFSIGRQGHSFLDLLNSCRLNTTRLYNLDGGVPT